MMENRELSMDDYLAMLRRRIKVILIPTLLAPLAGFFVSYAFPAKYTSQSLVLVEGQKVPEGIVQPVVTQDLTERIATLQQQVLSQSRLQPMLERSGLAKPGQNMDEVIDNIRLSNVGRAGGHRPCGDWRQEEARPEHPGSRLLCELHRIERARGQQICNELTSLLLEENLKSREDVARGTTDFLSKQVEDTKHNLDDLDNKLAAFKKQYMGSFPATRTIT